MFVSPFIIVLSGAMGNSDIESSILIFAYGVFFGLLFSIPSALLFAVSAIALAKKEFSVMHKRLILSVIGFALTLLAFLLFSSGKSILFEGNYFFAIYALVIIAGVWFYKLETPTHAMDINLTIPSN